MKVWDIKYAMTGGIREKTVEESPLFKNHFIIREGGFLSHRIMGRDIFKNRADAIKAATVARDRKIKSLEKQISKPQKLTFEE